MQDFPAGVLDLFRGIGSSNGCRIEVNPGTDELDGVETGQIRVRLEAEGRAGPALLIVGAFAALGQVFFPVLIALAEVGEFHDIFR